PDAPLSKGCKPPESAGSRADSHAQGAYAPRSVRDASRLDDRSERFFMSKRRRGLIMVVTGDGKAKTTSALGLAFRALANGFKVFMVQYIKGKWKTGEKQLADLLQPQ